jgi:Transposase
MRHANRLSQIGSHMVEQIGSTSKPQGLFAIQLGVTRRRRWSNEVKGQIVAEFYASGSVVSQVARRHGSDGC